MILSQFTSARGSFIFNNNHSAGCAVAAHSVLVNYTKDAGSVEKSLNILVKKQEKVNTSLTSASGGKESSTQA